MNTKAVGFCVGFALLALTVVGVGSSARAVSDIESVSPVLDSLLTFHPSWVSRSVTSHDPWGGNGDGSGDGIQREGEYHVLFHGKGEGRIERLWMTAPDELLEKDWKEIWIQADGHTVYRGKPLDFFAGKGPWKSPLVMDKEPSSGGYLSYGPVPYSHEAKILFLGEPHYFQVTYREGAGSSSGPSAQELTQFMADHWWDHVAARDTRVGRAAPGTPAIIAQGPATVSSFALHVSAADLKSLRVRVGSQASVPASFFFGLGSTGHETFDSGWGDVTSVVHYVDSKTHTLATRLPIPLQAGESIVIETVDRGPTEFRYSVATAPSTHSGVKLVTDYREQMGPGTDSTMPFFESKGPTQMVSMVEEITDGKIADRMYLEGDEMIRTDGMLYPLQLGTGTEDYFNGGWYFLGAHSNPMAGQPRFVVNDPSDGWSHARFEHSLYRNHIADPVVGRSGIRFGFETGEFGDYTPIRYRTLVFAYAFSDLKPLNFYKMPLSEVESSGESAEAAVVSAVDAEHGQQVMTFQVRSTRGRSLFRVACQANQSPAGIFLTRSYDAMMGDQEGTVSVNGRLAGMMFEAYANPHRRYAQDAIWLDLLPQDCTSGGVNIEVDSTGGHAAWTEVGYEATLFTGGASHLDSGRSPAVLPDSPIHQGERTHILDTRAVDGVPHYVNDHSIIEGSDGKWHIYGIFHEEPFDPEHEFKFVHATHSGTLRLPEQAGFSIEGIALSRDPALGETHIWAPHVVRDGERYVMVYQSGGENDRSQIRMAQSKDLNHWQRIGDKPLFEDVCVARDPMLRKTGDLWTIYYTRCNNTTAHRSGVAYRTSLDLLHWSEPRMALVLDQTAPMFNSGYTESPFVFERGGWYYLSVTSYPVEWNATFVYRSRSPYSFSAPAFARLEAHAAEWLTDEAGSLFMTSAGPAQQGVWMMPVSGI